MIRPAGIPTIETTRLVLRRPRAEDAPDLFAIHSSAEVNRYWSSPPMQQLAEAEARIAKLLQYEADGSGMGWMIERREDARVIGTLSLHRFDEQSNRAEVGYSLGREHWGKGYMSEALNTLIAYAFGPMDLRRLEADTDPRNTPSVRLLERVGFSREGLLRERWVVADEISDSVLLGLLRHEWQAARSAKP
jgi:RimJ/RimL family protein N-acetyltransferase